MAESRPCSRAIDRPLSSISSLAYRLKCSRLYDNLDYSGTLDSGSPSMKDIMCNKECTKMIGDSPERYWTSLDLLPEFQQCENNKNMVYCSTDLYDDSETWVNQSSPNTGTSLSRNVCFSTSAPENVIRFQSINCHLFDPDSQCTKVRTSPINGSSIICHCCMDPLPAKRSCRSLSASALSLKKPKHENGIRPSNLPIPIGTDRVISNQLNHVRRPVALRYSQQCLVATSEINSPQRSSSKPLQKTGSPNTRTILDPVALVRSGEVKLRNRVITKPHTSRLSWNHPLSSSCGPGSHPVLSANQAHHAWKINNHRYLNQSNNNFPLMSNVTGEFTPQLQKLPSLAQLHTVPDYNTNRLSAFTPTNSRRISPQEGTQTSELSCSPDILSSPHQNIASSASSGFSQDVFSNSFTGSRPIEEQLTEEHTEILRKMTVQRNLKLYPLSDTSAKSNHRTQYDELENTRNSPISSKKCFPTSLDALTENIENTISNGHVATSCCHFYPATYEISSSRCQSQPNAAVNNLPACARVFCEFANLPDCPLLDLESEAKNIKPIDTNCLKRRRCCQPTCDAKPIQNVTDVFLPGTNRDRISTDGIFIFGSHVTSVSQSHSESGTDTPVADSRSHESTSNKTLKCINDYFIHDYDPSVGNDCKTLERTGESLKFLKDNSDTSLKRDLASLSKITEIRRCEELSELSETSEEDDSNDVMRKIDLKCLKSRHDNSLVVSPSHHLQFALRSISGMIPSPVLAKSCPDHGECSACSHYGTEYSSNDISCLQFSGRSDDFGSVDTSPDLSPNIDRSPMLHRRGINVSLDIHRMQIDEPKNRFHDLEQFKELDINLIEQH